MKNLLLIILLIVPLVGNAFNAIEQADTAYNREDYAKAIELYNQALAQHGSNSDLYYNLGNAYFRNGKLGKAVLNYERALKANPTNADAKTNLKFVNSLIQDKPEDDSAFLANVHQNIMMTLRPNSWAFVSLFLFCLFLTAIGLYLFTNNVALRKTGFFGALAVLVVFLYVALVAYQSMNYALSHDKAVVTASSTQLSSAPRISKKNTDKVVTIHEGTRVEIIDSIATPDDPLSPKWYNVKINNNTKAWLRSVDVERI